MDGGTLTITDSELNCTDGHGTGIAWSNFSATRVKIHDCENALEMGANSSVVDSYLSSREATSDGHGDDIQSQGGNNVLIRHNTFAGLNPITSSIITNPTGNSHWLIEGNLVSAGALTLYCPEDPAQGDFVVRNNRFMPYKNAAGQKLYQELGDKRSPAYGQTDQCVDSRITWTGNYQDSDLRTVPAGGLN